MTAPPVTGTVLAVRWWLRVRGLLLGTPTTLWLDFLDSQYGDTPQADAIADALLRIVRERRPDAVLLPAGLFHSDHALAHDAALRLRQRDQVVGPGGERPLHEPVRAALVEHDHRQVALELASRAADDLERVVTLVRAADDQQLGLSRRLAESRPRVRDVRQPRLRDARAGRQAGPQR